MKCPKCGRIVPDRRNRCEGCGEDLVIYRKVYRLSNVYYNRGLEKAKIRDLSGAVLMLKRSLEMNKRNTHARNLLGLVYFEMGETVAALSEWVVSKNFQEEENDAGYYMDLVQSNPNKLEQMNQAIKKYNFALSSAMQDSEDLAVIQLKKVIGLNPKFLRAIHLLSLLYMKAGEHEKARKLLVRAAKIDVTNTVTLRYLRELNSMVAGDISAVKKEQADMQAAQFEIPTAYKEDKPNIMAYVNLVLGLVIGIVFVYFVIVPGIRSGMNEEYIAEQKNYAEEIAGLNASIQSLESENQLLLETADELRAELDSIEIPEYDRTMYDSLFTVIEDYLNYQESQDPEEAVAIAAAVTEIDTTQLENETAGTIADIIEEGVYPAAAEELYTQARALYDAGNYEEALPLFETLVTYDMSVGNYVYYTARCYHRAGDPQSAAPYYDYVIENFPGTNLARDARELRNGIQ